MEYDILLHLNFYLEGLGSCTHFLGHPRKVKNIAYRISSVIRQSFFFFQNNTKDLDPSCKTDLDHLGLFRKGKIGIIANFHHTDLVI